MLINTSEFAEKGRPLPAPTPEEELVIRDSASRGWDGELARGSNSPPGEPDLRAHKSARTIGVEVKKWSEAAPSVGFTQAQFPRHRSLTEAGVACYLAFVAGERIFHYLAADP